MSATQFDLVSRVLDHLLVDVDGMECGVVDDVLLEGAPGRGLRVVALVVGPGAWMPRLPRLVATLVRPLVRGRRVRVPWSAVAHVGERIELAQTAASLRLGVADRRVGRLVARIPGGTRAPE